MERYSADLPSVGLISFTKSPACKDFSKLGAEGAIFDQLR